MEVLEKLFLNSSVSVFHMKAEDAVGTTDQCFGDLFLMFATLDILIDHFTQSVVIRKKRDFAHKRFTSCASLVMLRKCFLFLTVTGNRHRLTSVR